MLTTELTLARSISSFIYHSAETDKDQGCTGGHPKEEAGRKTFMESGNEEDQEEEESC